MPTLAVDASIDWIIAAELDNRRTFRFDAETEPAVSPMSRGRIDPAPAPLAVIAFADAPRGSGERIVEGSSIWSAAMARRAADRAAKRRDSNL